MALSPKMQALVEAARIKEQNRQAAIKAASEPLKAGDNAVTGARASTPSLTNLHLTPTAKSISVGFVLSGTQNYQSVTGVPLNEKQQQAVELAMRGQSFNLCGAAGTGKTTTTREIIGQLVKMPHVTALTGSTRYLTANEPGVVIISFTNKAVNNIKKQLPKDLQSHCLTYHKLLEYKPIGCFDPMELEALGYGNQFDEEGNPVRKGGMFIPSWNKNCKLPHISTVIVEESSMVDTDLHQKLLDALPDSINTQFIFLGDLNQLPPIFGPSILGFKLVEQQTVELTHVYRQALLSPIITLAHKIREGRGWSGRLEESAGLVIDDNGEHGKVTIQPWKKKITSGSATLTMLDKFLIPMITRPDYDFENTVILCPFNKSFGTIALNKGIAHALGRKRNALVYEVVARYTRTYWAVGDRVIVDRQEAIITKIEPTPGYDGPIAKPPSYTMDRSGFDGDADVQNPNDEDDILNQTDDWDVLDSLILPGEGLETKNAPSHIVTVQFIDTGEVVNLDTAGQINGMLFSYVLTVHKSQGSEWRKVIILLHYTHNTMISRELIYTAVTRARHELHIICEPDRGLKDKHVTNSLTRAALNPEIKGITLAEKAEFFQYKKKQLREKEVEKKNVKQASFIYGK